MDAIGWRSTQGGEPAVDSGNWRSQLLPESRERVVTKIMDTLKKHLPYNDGPGGLQELKEIAARFEEKIFSSATNQTDYLRKISLKMLTMETKTNTVNSKPPNSVVSSNQNPQDSGSNSMQAQVVNQGQQMAMQTGNTQVQARQQLISQNIQNSIAPGGVQGSSRLTSAMSSISGLPSTNMPNVASQNSNLQNVQNMSGVSQNLVGNTTGQGISSSMTANSQRQIQGRQHTTPQQQQQSQNQQNYLYQQQLQQKQLMQSKSQQGGNISHSVTQSHMQQQQPNIIQSSQQPSIMKSASLSGLQQSQQINVQQPTQTGMQQNSQSVFRQQQQQQTSMINQKQQTVQSMQQQQSNANTMQHQLTGQQNSISDMQQQQQRMLSQQNNPPNMQQQQQLTSQTNNLTNMRHQKMSSNNVRLPQQSLGTQSVSTNMQTNQHPLQMLQQSKVPLQTQSQQGNTTLFQSLGQPSSHQSMAQNQSQTGQQQQLGMQQQQPIGMQQQQQKLSMQQQQQLDMQQQTILLQRDMQQRHQTSVPLLHQHNKNDPQKQLFESQRAVSEASSTSLDSTVQNETANSVDWQEETYQKIKLLKETYLPELAEMYQRIGVKLQQQDSVPQQSKNEQIEKLKMFRAMLERIITMLQISKSNILPTYGEKLPSYEKQILTVLHSTRKPAQQLDHSQMQSMQQQHSQITQMQQTHDNQLNAQLQQTGVQNSMSTIPQNTLTGQGNHLNNMQAVSVGSLQQNPTSSPQQVNMNVLQPNLSSVQSNASMLPSQHIKPEQQMLQTQPLKQQQRQMQQQLLHRQILQQQQPQQMKQQQQQPQQMKQQQQQPQQMKQQQQQPQQMKQQQQQPQQLKPQQNAQFQSQMNDINDLKMRQQLSAKSGIQPHSSGQRPAYQHQQMKSTTSFTIPSPQILQAASPQIDQQNILSSLTKTGTPLQSTNSPLMAPSPSTPFVLSPIAGESEKVSPGVSNTGNIRHHQASTIVPQSQSLAIGTPGISASPLLESTSPENHANASAVISGKSNVTEQPIDRLIRAVKSMSPSALSGSVSDIGSIVGMFDRIAGSAPGNSSRAAVGEDLTAMTKCCLQANNFSVQDGSPGMRKMRRYTTANFVTGSEASVVELTSRSCVKRPRFTANHHSLLDEIREINERLIDTVVDISDEKAGHIADRGEGGTIVKCSYSAVALSPTLKSQYASSQMLPIQPLRLLVPNNYPNCSPILLDKFPTEPSNESEDLSVKTKSRFSIHLRTLSEPMSLGEIARMWDTCSRAVILEYAQQNGGGNFSSIYGSWENCLSAV